MMLPESKESHGFNRGSMSKLARGIKQVKITIGEGVKGGRPEGSGTAQSKVQEWQELHPYGKKSECIKDTGLSKPTVYKWWT